MFLAAALLIFGLSQEAPVAMKVSASDASAAVDAAKSDSAATPSSSISTSSPLPSAPTPKLNEESSSTSAEAILPGTGIQPANPPKSAFKGFRYESPKQKIAWIGLSVAG